MKSIKALLVTVALLLVTLSGFSAFAQAVHPGMAPVAPHAGGEDSLRVPDLIDTQQFFGMPASHLLLSGLVVSALGIAFGLVIFFQLKNAPGPQVDARGLGAHLRDVQDLPLHPGQVPRPPLGVHRRRHRRLLRRPARASRRSPSSSSSLFSILGIAGSALVALFGIRVNTFANSRTAFAALRGKPFPVYAIPLKAGMSIGMLLISIELAFMLMILCLVSARVGGQVLHRLRHRRVARRRGAPRGRRHLHEDRRHRVGPHEDRLQDQGRRRA